MKSRELASAASDHGAAYLLTTFTQRIHGIVTWCREETDRG